MKKNISTTAYLDLLSGALYAFVVFFEVMSLSSWHYLHRGFESPNSKIVISAFCLIILIGFMHQTNLMKMLFSLIFLTTAVLYYLHLREVDYFTTLVLALCAGMSMHFDRILKIDFLVRTFTVLWIILLSLLHFLPTSGTDSSITGSFFTRFVYGFSYPNLLGYLIMILAFEFTVVFKKINVGKIFIILLAFMGAEIFLDYLTGFLGILVIMIVCIWNRHTGKRRSNSLLIICLVLIPCLALISVYVTRAYNASAPIWFQINQWMSLRIPIWQYYYQGWGINFWGSRILVNARTIGIIGYGAFDGAYLYFLLRYGVFSLIVIWLTIFSTLFLHNKNEEKVILAGLLMPIIITSFPETLGFINAYSPVFLLIGSAIFATREVTPDELLRRSQNDVKGKSFL
ncbi:hypothetical protein [Oenococcus sp.]|uniref:hypothetical protein n=1 Tax=Oenococcus sp. TaxID=1979414 RepID=UPI0039ECFC51